MQTIDPFSVGCRPLSSEPPPHHAHTTKQEGATIVCLLSPFHSSPLLLLLQAPSSSSFYHADENEAGGHREARVVVVFSAIVRKPSCYTISFPSLYWKSQHASQATLDLRHEYLCKTCSCLSLKVFFPFPLLLLRYFFFARAANTSREQTFFSPSRPTKAFRVPEKRNTEIDFPN